MRLVLEIGNKYPEISGSASDAFAADLQDACNSESFNELVLDMLGTKMISSMAMGTIYAISQKLRDQGKALHIINASEKVAHLLRMVNMADLIEDK